MILTFEHNANNRSFMKIIAFVADNIESSPFGFYGSIQIRFMMLLRHVCISYFAYLMFFDAY